MALLHDFLELSTLFDNLEEIRSRRRDGEGVGFEIRTVHELGRVPGDAVVIEVHHVHGDQVGGDDGMKSESLLSCEWRVSASLRVGEVGKVREVGEADG